MRSHLACLCLLVACAGRVRAPAAPTVSLTDALRARNDKGYEGGLDHDDLTLAQAWAGAAFAAGVPHKTCTPKDAEANGRVLSVARKGGPWQPANPVLQQLVAFIEAGNRHQRDVAVTALGRVGPGVDVSAGRLQNAGPWAHDALSAITCEAWTAPDVHELWSPDRDRHLMQLPYRDRAGVAVHMMIDQMLDRRLAFPDEVFSHALSNRGYDNGLSLAQVRRLLPVLTDAGYPRSIRLQAIVFIGPLQEGREVFAEALWDLYRGSDPLLSQDAGRMLMTIRSRHGSDVLADILESDRHAAWPRTWGATFGCSVPPRSERLVAALVHRLDDPILSVRRRVINALGCLAQTGAIPALLRALEPPFWTQQRAVAEALGRMPALPPEALTALETTAQRHWSNLVRTTAADALATIHGAPPRAPRRRSRPIIVQRRAVDNELPVCHGRTGDGQYRLPWLGTFEVRWEETRVHDLPAGFPIALHEMRARPGYGSNTFLRVDDGWLFSVDLWHYNGDFGFVSDGGAVQRFAPTSVDAAFILPTQLGITALGEDPRGGGDGGELAVVDRAADGTWRYRPLLELLSEAFGYAFAPDGTLLVKDPYGAVAITKDRRIVPLDCE